VRYFQDNIFFFKRYPGIPSDLNLAILPKSRKKCTLHDLKIYYVVFQIKVMHIFDERGLIHYNMSEKCKYYFCNVTA